mmetsp:Transcript_138209/g.243912  ORF Transcript_138209/g.243912 Transcript_138209/m.243912 type:complete len:565 (+) Transcript_138209:87-1781(+)
MPFYYDSSQPMFKAFFVIARTVTVFGMVSVRFEFWLFLLFHGICVVFSEHIPDEVPWDAVSATLLFLTFLMTFYNGHCYERYIQLYFLCMDVLDGVIFMILELNVSMCYPEVENHRIGAAKYTIALMHIFFVGVAGGMNSKADWREIVRRGLLSKTEAEQLAAYPARSMERVLLLASWAMQVVDIGLSNDAFFTERSMRIAHTHNRLEACMTNILHGIHEIEDILALPIPFTYYHLMNIVLLVNLFGLAIVCATFKTYMTVFPYSVALGFFMGLREVSVMLADPFNGEDTDFPVESFLQYAFDHAVCLLEAFRHETPEKYVTKFVKKTAMFTKEQLEYQMPHDILYTKSFDPAISSPFSWNKEMPIQEMIGTPEGPTRILQSCTAVIGDKPRSIVMTPASPESFAIQPREEEKQGILGCLPCCRKKKHVQTIEEEIEAERLRLAKERKARLKQRERKLELKKEVKTKSEADILQEQNHELQREIDEVLSDIQQEEQKMRARSTEASEALDRWKATGSTARRKQKIDESKLVKFGEFGEAQDLILNIFGRSSNQMSDSGSAIDEA